MAVIKYTQFPEFDTAGLRLFQDTAKPETVDPEGVKADYKNGVMTITLPKKEVAKPRQIKVQFGNN